MLAAGLQQARGLVPWQELAAACERAARDLRLAARRAARGARQRSSCAGPSARGATAFVAALDAARRSACEAARAALDTVSELAPDFVRLPSARSTSPQLARALRRAAPRPASALDRPGAAAGAPGRVAARHPRGAARADARPAPKAWIFTSATLGDDARLSWFTEPRRRSTSATTLRVGSPFDYATHARVYVPRAFPKPNEPGHAQAVARLAARCARALGGRTFVLTTTLRVAAADRRGAARTSSSATGDGIEVLVQGQRPKRQLMQRFLDGAARACWSARRASGKASTCPAMRCSACVIDKLPFPPPNDPLVEARVAAARSARAAMPFNDYFVAEAAVSLKQGAGRLIRSETDRGLLVVCDPRMATMGYGRRLLRGAAADDARSSDEARGDGLAARAGARGAGSAPERALTRTATTGVCLSPQAARRRSCVFGKFVFSTRSASSRSCVRPSAS